MSTALPHGNLFELVEIVTFGLVSLAGKKLNVLLVII